MPTAPQALRRVAHDGAIALSGTAVAMAVFGAWVSWVGPASPLVVAFPAVALVAWWAGPIAATVSGLLMFAWLHMPWLPPAEDALPSGSLTPAAGAVFVAGVTLIAFVAGRARSPVPVSDDDATAGSRGILFVMVLAAVLPLAAFIAGSVIAHARAFENAAIRADRATRIAQEHASKLFDTNEAILGRLLELARDRSDAQLRRDEAQVHRRLVEIVGDFPQVQSIWIIDANGRPLATNRFLPAPYDTLDISDRDYFRWHREHRGGLYVSEPGVGRITRQAFVDTSRRRESADGRFDGLVSVSLSPEYLERFYAELAQTEPGLNTTLVRSDGTILARYPPPPDDATVVARKVAFMDRIDAGELHGVIRRIPSGIDGVERLLAFRAVDRYPVYVSAAIATAVITDGWQREMTVLAAILFPMSGVLVAMSAIAYRGARREARSRARLQHEVDSRERAEKALVQSQKLEALGHLTGSVAHDFNNLLAIVANTAHLLERTVADPRAAAQVAAIRRAVATGTQLTRQLLSFSRRQPLRPVTLALPETLSKTLELIRTTVGASVTVTLQVDDDVAPVKADEAELELALINVALNARDAMPRGGRLEVTARNRRHDDDRTVPPGAQWVAIAVRDTGEGIAPELVARVFEPFFSTKGPGRGTGLGLSQVLGMCQQAGGTARIDSRPGHGTTVTLYLPGSDERPPERARSVGGPLRSLDCDLLLVEDNPEVARTMRQLLESFGARVVPVATARAALDRADRREPSFDLVLSDVMLAGGADGLALARLLHERDPTLPVLLMTGYAGELHDARAQGFEVFAKPCVPEELHAAIARALASRVRPPRDAGARPTEDRGGPHPR